MEHNKELMKAFIKVSKEKDIPVKVVVKIWESMWKKVSNSIKEATIGEYETYRCILVPGFGKFYPKAKKSIEKFKDSQKVKEYRKNIKLYNLQNSTDNIIGKI